MCGKQNRNSKIFSLNIYYGVYMGSGRGGGADQKKVNLMFILSRYASLYPHKIVRTTTEVSPWNDQ